MVPPPNADRLLYLLDCACCGNFFRIHAPENEAVEGYAESN
jgi:hypothetical protein